MDELKPCPFCGGKAERGHYDGIVWIECTECEASTKGIDTGLFYEQAIAAWNRRTEPPESEARATHVSGDSPIAVRCPACGCPVVEHQLYEDGVQVGERIECACGYKRQFGKEG